MLSTRVIVKYMCFEIWREIKEGETYLREIANGNQVVRLIKEALALGGPPFVRIEVHCNPFFHLK